MKKLIVPLLACIVCAVIVSVIAVSVRYEQNLNKENEKKEKILLAAGYGCLLYTSPSPRDQRGSRMPSSA